MTDEEALDVAATALLILANQERFKAEESEYASRYDAHMGEARTYARARKRLLKLRSVPEPREIM